MSIHDLEAYRGCPGASYLRFSSIAQRLGDSSRRQMMASTALMVQFDIQPVPSLMMADEGLSAYRSRHIKDGALGEFLRRAVARQLPDRLVLIVEDLDRLSRDRPMRAFSQFGQIIENDVAIFTVIDSQLYTKSSLASNMSQLFLSLGRMIQSHWDSKIKGDRVKESWNAERRLRISDVHPGWIRPNADRSDWEIIPEKQEIIIQILEKCRDGIGLDRIAHHLNKTGVMALSNRKTTLGGWHDGTIRRLITSRDVLGEIEVGEYVENKRRTTGEFIKKYPPVVDERLWQSANDALRQRRKTGGAHAAKMVNLFSGMCVCGVCGGRMRIKRSRKAYLICSNAKFRDCSNRVMTRYDGLERFVIDWFASVCWTVPDDEAERRTVENEIAVVTREVELSARAYASAFKRHHRDEDTLTKTTLSEMKTEHQLLDARLEKLKRESRGSSTIERDAAVKRAMASIAQMDDLPADQRSALRSKLNSDLRRVIHSITIGPGDKVHIQVGKPKNDK